MRDCNDILYLEEKRGQHPRPHWLVQGFKEAAKASGLKALAFEGHQFTWEMGRGMPRWVEEKLEIILVSNN